MGRTELGALLGLLGAYVTVSSLMVIVGPRDFDVMLVANNPGPLNALWLLDGRGQILTGLVSGTLGFDAFAVFVAIIIGAAIFPLYLIARHIGISKFASLLVCAAYLLYVPAWGVFGTGFGVGILFPAPFFAAVYLVMKGRVKWGLALMVLDVPIIYWSVYPVIFGLAAIAFGPSFISTLKRWEGLPLNGATLSLVACGFLVSGASATAYATRGGQLTAVQTDWGITLFTVLVSFAPLLFIPLLSPRWMLFLIPWVILITVAGGYSNFSGTPFLVNGEHVTTVAPFLFLGLIDGLKRFKDAAPAIIPFILITLIISTLTTAFSIYPSALSNLGLWEKAFMWLY